MEIFLQASKSIFIVFQVSVTFSSITQQRSEQALHGENTNCGLFLHAVTFQSDMALLAPSETEPDLRRSIQAHLT